MSNAQHYILLQCEHCQHVLFQIFLVHVHVWLQVAQAMLSVLEQLVPVHGMRGRCSLPDYCHMLHLLSALQAVAEMCQRQLWAMPITATLRQVVPDR